MILVPTNFNCDTRTHKHARPMTMGAGGRTAARRETEASTSGGHGDSRAVAALAASAGSLANQAEVSWVQQHINQSFLAFDLEELSSGILCVAIPSHTATTSNTSMPDFTTTSSVCHFIGTLEDVPCPLHTLSFWFGNRTRRRIFLTSTTPNLILKQPCTYGRYGIVVNKLWPNSLPPSKLNLAARCSP